MRSNFLILSLTLIVQTSCSKNVQTVEKNTLVESNQGRETALIQWTQTVGLSNPESIHQATDGLIYVSKVAGDPTAKDGLGWISRYDAHGQLLTDKFTTGLNAPKGLRSTASSLWVSDIDQVIEINLSSGKILRKVSVPHAKFLNDIEVSETGDVYVSDMLDNVIYLIKGKKVTKFVKGPDLEHPNGLLLKDNKLYVASWGQDLQSDFTTKIPGSLYSIDLKTKTKTTVTKIPLGNLDGLEFDGQRFFVSDWISGNLYAVTPDGEAKLFLSDKKGLADFGLTHDKKSLLLANMLDSKIWSRSAEGI